MSCGDLAKKLSQNYRQTDPFHPDENDPFVLDDKIHSFLRSRDSSTPNNGSLTKYLTTHGILLTMCMGQFGCKLVPGYDNHVAASWINRDIGAQVIPTLPPFGHILDPSLMTIQCLYPTDAATAIRKDNGCGPPDMTIDPMGFGAKGAKNLPRWKRYLWKRQIENYINQNFGAETAWEDIPCDLMLQTYVPGLGIHSAIFWEGNETSHNAANDKTVGNMVEDFGKFVMGHPICSPNGSLSTNITYGKDDWWIYNGDSSWAPDEWQAAIDMQLKLQQEYPDMDYTWNEIVLDVPTSTLSPVSAIFHVVGLDPEIFNQQQLDTAKKLAHEAATFYKKPLMTMNITAARNGDDILSCEGFITE